MLRIGLWRFRRGLTGEGTVSSVPDSQGKWQVEELPLTPLKMNMSPEKGPFQKEHGLRAIIFAGDMLVFRVYDSQIRFFYNSFCFLLPNCYLSSISLICQDSCFRCSHVSSNQKLATKLAKTKCRCSKRHWHCFFPTKNTLTGRPSRVKHPTWGHHRGRSAVQANVADVSSPMSALTGQLGPFFGDEISSKQTCMLRGVFLFIHVSWL